MKKGKNRPVGVTASMVFEALRHYRHHPCKTNYERFDKLWKAWESRFKKRSLCFYTETVAFLGFEVR